MYRHASKQQQHRHPAATTVTVANTMISSVLPPVSHDAAPLIAPCSVTALVEVSVGVGVTDRGDGDSEGVADVVWLSVRVYDTVSLADGETDADFGRVRVRDSEVVRVDDCVSVEEREPERESVMDVLMEVEDVTEPVNDTVGVCDGDGENDGVSVTVPVSAGVRDWMSRRHTGWATRSGHQAAIRGVSSVSGLHGGSRPPPVTSQ